MSTPRRKSSSSSQQHHTYRGNGDNRQFPNRRGGEPTRRHAKQEEENDSSVDDDGEEQHRHQRMVNESPIFPSSRSSHGRKSYSPTLSKTPILLPLPLLDDDDTTTPTKTTPRTNNHHTPPPRFPSLDQVDPASSPLSSSSNKKNLVHKFALAPFKIYTGNVSSSSSPSTPLPHGKGELVDEQAGKTYRGEFVHGMKCGFGRTTYHHSSTQFHEGHYDHNTRHGSGFFVFHNGDKFVGEFRLGLFHGQGQLIFGNGGDTLEGQFHKGEIVHGIKHFSNGDVYEGQFREGSKPHGYGKYRFMNGDMYKGFFRDGMFEGRGCHTSVTDQTTSYARFQNGKMVPGTIKVVIRKQDRFVGSSSSMPDVAGKAMNWGRLEQRGEGDDKPCTCLGQGQFVHIGRRVVIPTELVSGSILCRGENQPYTMTCTNFLSMERHTSSSVLLRRAAVLTTSLTDLIPDKCACYYFPQTHRFLFESSDERGSFIARGNRF